MPIPSKDLKVGLLVMYDESITFSKEYVEGWGKQYKNQIAEIIEFSPNGVHFKLWWPVLQAFGYHHSIRYFKKVNK